MEWIDLAFIGLAIISLCGACWREGRLSGFDKGIEKGVEIGRDNRVEP